MDGAEYRGVRKGSACPVSTSVTTRRRAAAPTKRAPGSRRSRAGPRLSRTRGQRRRVPGCRPRPRARPPRAGSRRRRPGRAGLEARARTDSARGRQGRDGVAAGCHPDTSGPTSCTMQRLRGCRILRSRRRQCQPALFLGGKARMVPSLWSAHERERPWPHSSRSEDGSGVQPVFCLQTDAGLEHIRHERSR